MNRDHVHKVSTRRTPVGLTLHCSCGWSARVPCRNALGRASQRRALVSAHLRTVGGAK